MARQRGMADPAVGDSSSHCVGEPLDLELQRLRGLGRQQVASAKLRLCSEGPRRHQHQVHEGRTEGGSPASQDDHGPLRRCPLGHGGRGERGDSLLRGLLQPLGHPAGVRAVHVLGSVAGHGHAGPGARLLLLRAGRQPPQRSRPPRRCGAQRGRLRRLRPRPLLRQPALQAPERRGGDRPGGPRGALAAAPVSGQPGGSDAPPGS
mmetsp:Transcript_15626/g.44816  ORF Transcript_15626/g.44816 Transcript_15626/m.44816 type:complete len:206 (-) Transcript_15626:50-667(-)